MSEESTKNQTDRNKAVIKSTLKLAKFYAEDPQQKNRQQVKHCLVCYYTPRIVLHAFHSAECDQCKVTMTFRNSFTDTLCADCAENLACCAHCGGERELC